MMVQNFRAWWKPKKKMVDVRVIDWNNQVVDGLHPDIEISFDDIVLLQSTGIVDKNRTEIFEGDIIRTERFTVNGTLKDKYYHKEYIGVVKISEGAWWIDNGQDAVELWSEVDPNTVIGNIYENPKLLEVIND